MFDVIKGVELPKTLRGGLVGVRKYPFDRMEVGDMFFVPNKTKNTLSTHASTVGKDLKRKFTTRMTRMVKTEDGWVPAVNGDEGAVLGIGVWRVE